jgi:predicted cobalt transporter CbtA
MPFLTNWRGKDLVEEIATRVVFWALIGAIVGTVYCCVH